jgi:DNA-binding NtrC family response regulator
MIMIHESSYPHPALLTAADLGPSAFPASARRVGRITLRACNGPYAGKALELPAAQAPAPRVLRGGRSPVGDIVLHDPRVSPAHFDLVLGESHVLVRDLDGPGGVLVGGVPVREAWLSPGDSFQVGDSELQLAACERVDVPLALTDHFGAVYGRSSPMRGLFCDLSALIERGDRLGVVLCGEPGTGKELVARGIHAASMRGARPFVVFDAAAATPELAALQLLGHRRDDLAARGLDPCGHLERADGGTLYIAHVDALAPALQSQLLRALQEGVVTRQGEQTPRRADVRVICSTHRDLRRLAAEDVLHTELYFRIAGVTLELPPLHARDGDIPLLAEHFLHGLVAAEQRVRRFDADALAALQAHPWPTHVQGLRDAVERGYFAGDGETISRADLGLHRDLDRGLTRRVAGVEALFGIDHAEAVARFERLYFVDLLRTHPSKAKATRTSGMTHEGFRLALRRLQITRPALARPRHP